MKQKELTKSFMMICTKIFQCCKGESDIVVNKIIVSENSRLQ